MGNKYNTLNEIWIALSHEALLGLMPSLLCSLESLGFIPSQAWDKVSRSCSVLKVLKSPFHYKNKTASQDLLINVFITGLTHPHLPLNAKLGDGGVFAWTVPTEHLATGTTVVLQDAEDGLELALSNINMQHKMGTSIFARTQGSLFLYSLQLFTLKCVMN